VKKDADQNSMSELSTDNVSAMESIEYELNQTNIFQEVILEIERFDRGLEANIKAGMNGITVAAIYPLFTALHAVNGGEKSSLEKNNLIISTEVTSDDLLSLIVDSPSRKTKSIVIDFILQMLHEKLPNKNDTIILNAAMFDTFDQTNETAKTELLSKKIILYLEPNFETVGSYITVTIVNISSLLIAATESQSICSDSYVFLYSPQSISNDQFDKSVTNAKSIINFLLSKENDHDLSGRINDLMHNMVFQIVSGPSYDDNEEVHIWPFFNVEFSLKILGNFNQVVNHQNIEFISNNMFDLDYCLLKRLTYSLVLIQLAQNYYQLQRDILEIQNKDSDQHELINSSLLSLTDHQFSALKMFSKSSIHFPFMNVTDTGLAHISSLQSLTFLNLYYCEKITDAGLTVLSSLSNLTTLQIGWCNNITDKGLQYLKNIHTLKLNKNDKITNNGLKYLKNIHTLNIYCNECITNDGLKHMHNIHTINLYKNKNNDSNKYYNILDNSDSDLINHDLNLAKIIIKYKKYIPNIKYFSYNVN
jgi:hypothetical protein